MASGLMSVMPGPGVPHVALLFLRRPDMILAYRYDLGIMGIMPVAGGCLTRKKTQECLAILS